MSTIIKKKRHTSLDVLFRYAEALKYGDFHVKFDQETGLKAIVAIHNLNRGPAIGGCRMIHYDNTNDALEDALRLGQMMSLKAAISDLAHGGAKSVLLKPKVMHDRQAYFESFGDFVDSLGGRYITAVDSGTSEKDMDIVATRTKFVSCTTSTGDPSPQTAFGVRRSIEAAVKFKLGRDNLENAHITIQGAGHVGYYLAKELHELGARLTMCDVNPVNLQRCVDEFQVAVCPPEAIFDIEADVFSPCALGKVLNHDHIKRLKVAAVAGSANNQLAHSKYAKVMKDHGILYAPDFLANAGGLIQVAMIYAHAGLGTHKAHEKINHIYSTMLEIFGRAQKENRTTHEVAEQIAKEKLLSPKFTTRQ